MPLSTLEKLINKEHLPDYYEQLLHHHKEIIASVKKVGKGETANILNMTAPKFSIIYKMIIAYAVIQGE